MSGSASWRPLAIAKTTFISGDRQHEFAAHHIRGEQQDGRDRIGERCRCEQTHQTSIDAVNSVVGYNNVSGNNALLTSTTITANIAKLEALANAEKRTGCVLAAARETLKNAGTAESAGPF